jgi:hypothetical protein
MKAPGYEEMQDWRAGLLPYWSSQPTGWLRNAVTRRQPFRLHRCADLVRNGEQHMGYTLGQAAKAVGMSKTSILRSIKAGRISAGRDEFGQWAIETESGDAVLPPNGESHDPGSPAHLSLLMPTDETVVQSITELTVTEHFSSHDALPLTQ